jgi:hypothetical protein
MLEDYLEYATLNPTRMDTYLLDSIFEKAFNMEQDLFSKEEIESLQGRYKGVH